MSLHMIEGVKIPASFDLPARADEATKHKDLELFDRALELIEEKGVFLISHYYTSELMQMLAEKSGGFIGDSLEMARAGRDSDRNMIAVAGVRFMGETAKILSPDKTVIMPDLHAECSLDLCCDVDELERVRKEHPNAVLVSYANTSARVKAISDWIVTSSMAVDLASYLKRRGQDILWVPDKNLGAYISASSGVDIYCWPGMCIVHDAFLGNALSFMKKDLPDAKVLVHPEAPADVIGQADFVGSTSQILNYVKKSDAKEFIIATERNIFYKIYQACPDKKLIQAPTAGEEGQCISCANCPWMELNTVEKLINAIENPQGFEITVDPDICARAERPLGRMLEFSRYLKTGGEIPDNL